MICEFCGKYDWGRPLDIETDSIVIDRRYKDAEYYHLDCYEAMVAP